MKHNIENYENMTLEEKLAALEAYEPDMSGYVAKSQLEKANSEAAAYKRQLREKMSEDEAAKAKEAEERAALEARVKELEMEHTVNQHVSKYLAIGYEEKMARASAEALANGDMETVFKHIKEHIADREKTLKAELLKQTPPPAAGNPDAGMTKEAFAKLSLAEKQKLADENPETFKSFYSKEE